MAQRPDPARATPLRPPRVPGCASAPVSRRRVPPHRRVGSRRGWSDSGRSAATRRHLRERRAFEEGPHPDRPPRRARGSGAAPLTGPLRRRLIAPCLHRCTASRGLVLVGLGGRALLVVPPGQLTAGRRAQSAVPATEDQGRRTLCAFETATPSLPPFCPFTPFAPEPRPQLSAAALGSLRKVVSANAARCPSRSENLVSTAKVRPLSLSTRLSRMKRGPVTGSK